MQAQQLAERTRQAEAARAAEEEQGKLQAEAASAVATLHEAPVNVSHMHLVASAIFQCLCVCAGTATG